MDQIKHLRNAVEHTIELSKLKGIKTGMCAVCEGLFIIHLIILNTMYDILIIKNNNIITF